MTRRWRNDMNKVTMFTTRDAGEARTEPELLPTDVQIAACLWDGLNYVQSNGPHIQCYLQIPLEIPLGKKELLLLIFQSNRVTSPKANFVTRWKID
ncbi:hypothetical protein JTB14_019362 [Gonioctena quinquepunctata]|nr:hypothetical protein JTB14_019362 [Gonioctena quinquepunctata]